LATIVVCDGCGWFVYAFGNDPKLVMSSESDPCFPDELLSGIGAVASSHPFVERWATIREPAALMLADMPQRVLRRHYDEHRDLYACMGRHNLTVPVTLSAAGAGALSFRTYRRSFTEEDRLVANLLRPHLQQAYANAEIFSRAIGNITGHPVSAFAERMTVRESEVAFWVAQGKTNREISMILSTAPRTIEKHVESILKKLHVENRTTAALELSRVLQTGAPQISRRTKPEGNS
jgi:DNA-binding CsgD family transcriptional regulator